MGNDKDKEDVQEYYKLSGVGRVGDYTVLDLIRAHLEGSGRLGGLLGKIQLEKTDRKSKGIIRRARREGD